MSLGYEIELFCEDDFDSEITCPSSSCGSANVVLAPVILADAAGGAGDAVNVNTTGVGVFKQVSGTTLEFKGVDAGTGINVTENLVNNTIEVSNGRIKVVEVLPSVGPIPVTVSSALLPNTIDAYEFLDSFGNEIGLAVRLTSANTLEICTGGPVLSNVQACLLGT